MRSEIKLIPILIVLLSLTSVNIYGTGGLTIITLYARVSDGTKQPIAKLSLLNPDALDLSNAGNDHRIRANLDVGGRRVLNRQNLDSWDQVRIHTLHNFAAILEARKISLSDNSYFFSDGSFIRELVRAISGYESRFSLVVTERTPFSSILGGLALDGTPEDQSSLITRYAAAYLMSIFKELSQVG